MANQIGEQFARALAGRNAPALKGLLRPDLDFRAMTPSRFWESADADTVVDEIMFGTWFKAKDRITDVVSIDTADVGSRHRVGYRFKVTRPDGDYLVEQQAYFETEGDRISWLRIMCAGYVGDTL
jgi:hypothetical protein